jgi:hypothetical protein
LQVAVVVEISVMQALQWVAVVLVDLELPLVDLLYL